MNSRVVLLQGYVALYSSYMMMNNNKVPAPKEHTVLKAEMEHYDTEQT